MRACGHVVSRQNACYRFMKRVLVCASSREKRVWVIVWRMQWCVKSTLMMLKSLSGANEKVLSTRGWKQNPPKMSVGSDKWQAGGKLSYLESLNHPLNYKSTDHSSFSNILIIIIKKKLLKKNREWNEYAVTSHLGLAHWLNKKSVVSWTHPGWALRFRVLPQSCILKAFTLRPASLFPPPLPPDMSDRLNSMWAAQQTTKSFICAFRRSNLDLIKGAWNWSYSYRTAVPAFTTRGLSGTAKCRRLRPVRCYLSTDCCVVCFNV